MREEIKLPKATNATAAEAGDRSEKIGPQEELIPCKKKNEIY